MRVELQPAFIIHRRAYRNTSWLLEVFTRDYGLITLVAKGSKRPGHQWHFILEPFKSLQLSFTGRTELMTLTGVELGQFQARFTGDKIFAGLYLNELLQRLLHRHDPYETLYAAYEIALHELELAVDSIEPALRRYELCLLREIGYGLRLDREVHANKNYCYDIEKGLVDVDEHRSSGPIISGHCLLFLADENYSDATLLVEMKRLLRYVLNHHLAGKPIKSRELFSAKSRSE